MPIGLVKNHLYSAYYLARFNRIGSTTILAVRTEADDWRRSFLISVDQNLELIDHLRISDNIRYPIQDSNGNEIVGSAFSRINFLSDTSFQTTELSLTEYLDDQQLVKTEIDSINQRFTISPTGAFHLIKRDSIRIVK